VGLDGAPGRRVLATGGSLSQLLGRLHDQCGGYVLEQLLSHSSSAVLSLLELGDPVVDAGVEFRERFFLLEHALV